MFTVWEGGISLLRDDNHTTSMISFNEYQGKRERERLDTQFKSLPYRGLLF